jgi:type II secretory pathway component PulF
VLGPLIVIIFLFLRVGLANPRIRYNWDAFLVTLPYAGETLMYLAMARFGRAFSALHQAGVPMQRSLLLAADACGNEYLRAKIYPAQRMIQAGEGITETFASTQAFSPIVMDMVRTGEMTGDIDKMLTRSSEFYIEESKVRQHQLAIVVGVIVSLIVAIYIGYLVISFWTGYIGNMNAAVGSGG